MRVFVPAFFGLMVAVTFAGLRIGEVGVDVLKSLPPLLVALNPWSKGALVRLRERRQKLSREVVDVIERFKGSDRLCVTPRTGDHRAGIAPRSSWRHRPLVFVSSRRE